MDRQLAGDPRYNFDPARGTVNAPWIAWGPYLWADGLDPRSDGLTWACGDLQADGTHPAVPGRQKVARRLLDFFRSDPATIPWLLRCTGSVPREVRSLLVARRDAGVELSWASQDGSAGAATDYDVLQGPLDALRARGGFDGASCLASDRPDTPYLDTAGLVLHWKLDEGAGTVATDSSGLANHGLVSSAVWTNGQLGGALRFDGATSVVSVPAGPGLSPALHLTVAAWANPDALTNGVIASRWISGSQETWMFRIRPDGTLRGNISPTPADGTYNFAAETASPVLAAGVWHHVAMVYDGSQPSDAARLKIYVDGVARPLGFSPGGIPTGLNAGTAALSAGLGADQLRAYSGLLDDLRVYDRSLGDQEVLALRTGTSPGRSTWYKVRARNACGAGSWGNAQLDGHAAYCP